MELIDCSQEYHCMHETDNSGKGKTVNDPRKNSLSALLDGARTFRQTEYSGGRSLMARLSQGQEPDVLLIACSDSRVDPALVFGARPGDIFVVRVVANLVPSRRPGDATAHGVMAAVEYGVKALGVSHVVVCGHSHCGGIQAAMDVARGRELPPFECLGPWVGLADAACREVLAEDSAGERSEAETAAAAEQRSVLKSLANLRSYAWIQDRVERGDLALHGWWFDIDTGYLWTADPETGAFRPAPDDR